METERADHPTGGTGTRIYFPAEFLPNPGPNGKFINELSARGRTAGRVYRGFSA